MNDAGYKARRKRAITRIVGVTVVLCLQIAAFVLWTAVIWRDGTYPSAVTIWVLHLSIIFACVVLLLVRLHDYKEIERER